MGYAATWQCEKRWIRGRSELCAAVRCVFVKIHFGTARICLKNATVDLAWNALVFSYPTSAFLSTKTAKLRLVVKPCCVLQRVLSEVDSKGECWGPQDLAKTK